MASIYCPLLNSFMIMSMTIPEWTLTLQQTAQAKRLFGNEKVWVEVHRGKVWDKVENPNPQSTPQVLPLFEEYTSPVTYPKEVEETLGTLIEVEPLDETQLEDLGLNACNYDIPLGSREVSIFDELEPRPQPLPNFPSLDASLGGERGPKPPIKPHSLDSFRMKLVDNLTIHTPSSPHVASFYLKDLYCYYHPCIDDPKKHYGFKPGLLGHSGSLGRKAHLLEDKKIPSVGVFDECASISDSLKEEPEFNQRLLRAAEGYIQNSTRLTEIANSLRAINFPIFQDRITVIENTRLAMHADISSIKGMVTEMFQMFKGFSSSTPSGSSSIPTITPPEVHATIMRGDNSEKQVVVNTTKEPEFEDVEKEPEVENVEREPEHEPQDTKPISITIIRLITKPALEVEMIGSSSRLQLTNTILEVQIPQPEPQHTTSKLIKRIGLNQRSDDITKEVVNKPLLKVSSVLNAPAHMEMKREWRSTLKKKIFGTLLSLELIKVVLEEAPKLDVDPKALYARRVHQELEHEVRIPRLVCNRSLPEGVSFVNNLVIEQPENGIFFIDVFGDEAFQRISDIQKVDVDILLSYLVMALKSSSTPTNQRLCAALRSLIDIHPDKEKLK
ncbi:hypothetical protein Tco_1385502 [Tanacetum coccineum]